MAQPARKARKGKIEPFDYSVAANAPALKGMTSFLDIPPEALRETSLRSLAEPGAIAVPELLLRRLQSITPMLAPPTELIPAPADKTTPGDETLTSVNSPTLLPSHPASALPLSPAPELPNPAHSPESSSQLISTTQPPASLQADDHAHAQVQAEVQEEAQVSAQYAALAQAAAYAAAPSSASGQPAATLLPASAPALPTPAQSLEPNSLLDEAVSSSQQAQAMAQTPAPAQAAAYAAAPSSASSQLAPRQLPDTAPGLPNPARSQEPNSLTAGSVSSPQQAQTAVLIQAQVQAEGQLRVRTVAQAQAAATTAASGTIATPVSGQPAATPLLATAPVLPVSAQDTPSGSFGAPAIEADLQLSGASLIAQAKKLQQTEVISNEANFSGSALQMQPNLNLDSESASIYMDGFSAEAIADSVAPEVDKTTPGDESASGMLFPLTSQVASPAAPRPFAPGIGRSKVRRCVLAQDGHSLGEEAIYQILWKLGSPEDSSPQSARTVEVGAAEIGLRANMAKKNVRQNLSRLFEKLAIEVLEEFHTVTSKPRRYRVYSYRQILERRRAAGLEFVLRNKGVVFCTESGNEIDLSRKNERAPGDESSPRPATSKQQRLVERRLKSLAPPVQTGVDHEISQICELVCRHWPMDEDAARQLLAACRQVQPDARLDEILFFLGEKIGRVLQSRGIVNPVGLLLATVPRSFAGSSFASFRLARDSKQQMREAEERRRVEEEEALRQWLHEEVAKCEAVLASAESSEAERERAEIRLRGFASWNL